MPSLFTREQYDSLKRAERRVHDTLPMIQKAEACGIECQQYRGVAEALLEQIKNIEHEFFSPPPK